MSTGARTVAAAFALAIVVAVLAYRAAPRVNRPGGVEAERWVLQDFRDAVYYPVVALLDGRNPYDQDAQARAYPVGQSFPLYLPVTLLAHLPFGILPPAEAGRVYFVATIVLTGVLATLAITAAGVPVTVAGALGLAALLLASRPGQMNLLLGQVTAQVTIGAYGALCWARRRPLLAALCLALATLKPTYGVPLAVLMLLGRGDLKAVILGAAVAGAACLLVGSAVHAPWPQGPHVARRSAAGFAVEGTSMPGARAIDATALVARLLGRAPGAWTELGIAVVVVGGALFGLRRLAPEQGAAAEQLGVGLICLTILVATYHQTYDAMLLTQPAVALAAGRWGRDTVAPAWLRWTVIGLLAVPAVNYLATNTVSSRLDVGGPAWLAVTSANPAAMLAAWSVHLGLAMQSPRA